MKNLFVRYFTFDIFIIKGILPARESTIQYSVSITEMVFFKPLRSPEIRKNVCSLLFTLQIFSCSTVQYISIKCDFYKGV